MRASDTASARYGPIRSSVAIWPSLNPSGALVPHADAGTGEAGGDRDVLGHPPCAPIRQQRELALGGALFLG